jgi:serine/threonine-protein kinase
LQNEASSARQRWARLTDLFDEWVELPAEQRADRLRELQRSEPELAERLRVMLDADADADPLLREGSAIDVPGAAQALVEQLIPGQEQTDPWPRMQALARRRLQPPERVGPYRLVERLGIGGMGEVWLGERDDGSFDQRVAIKLVAYPGRSLAERFERERQILARLQHRSIARLYDGGQTPEGLPYLVMEYVEGLPITDHVRAHRPSLRTLLNLLIDVCEAVDHAHRLMVVHRDLKPSNVLIDGNGQVKLLDFGIAKLLDEGAPALTLGDDQPMTPLYAAPEQILGEPVSASSDVYALGAILYELITGRLPTLREGLPLTQLAEAVSRETVSPPSRVLTESAHGGWSAGELRGDLDLLILTALHADPSRRYPTAAALGEDLRRWMAGLPLRARPDHWAYRMGKFARRHRLPLAGLGLILLSLATGFSLAVSQARLTRDQLQGLQNQLGAERSARALGIRALLAASSTDGTPDARAERLLVTARLARIELATQPLLLAELQLGLAFALLELDQTESARALLGQIDASLRRVEGAPADSTTRAALWQRLAQAWRSAGNPAAEEEALQQSAELDKN